MVAKLQTYLRRPRLLRGASTDSRRSSSSSLESTTSIRTLIKKVKKVNGNKVTTKLTKYEINEGPASLQEIIANRDWDRAIKLIRIRSNFAKKKSVVPCFLNEWKGMATIYPVHQACASPSVPVALIDSLLFAYPDAIKEKDSLMQRNCLHIALRSGASEVIAVYLLGRFPFLALEQDVHGRIPLHYACSNNCSMKLVRLLINACPQSVCAPDKRGWTPFHVVVSKQSSDIDIPRFMASVCPEVITMKTFAGSTPLNIIDQCPTYNSESYYGIIHDTECQLFQSPSFQITYTANDMSSLADSYV